MATRTTPRTLAFLTLLAVLLSGKTTRAFEQVLVTAELAKTRAAPGDTVEVRFHVQVPAGWHLYPEGSKAGWPIGAKLTKEVAGISPGPLEPKGGQKTITLAGEEAQVLEGTFDIAWPLKVGADAPSGKVDLAGVFSYQACNDKVCDKPHEVKFAFPLEVEGLPSFGPPAELPPPAPAHFAFRVEPGKVKQGDAAILVLEMFVAPGNHTYPPGSTSGDPVKLKISPPKGVTLEGALRTPPTHEITFYGEKCQVYEGTARFEQTLRVAADAAPGEVAVAIDSTWQVCDDKTCQPGKQKGDAAFTIVARGANDAPPTPPSTTAPPPSTSATTAPSTESGPAIGTRGLVVTAILAGIANLLMPCTFPMIPITISIFSKGKKLSRGKTAFRAGVYAAGIIVSFTIVGGVVQAVFGGRGQQIIGAIATNGPLNLAITAAFVYFALSFFGYYEVELPAFLRNMVERSVSKAQGAPGSEAGVPTIALFLMGLFFVLTSYTCGAPIILGVLAVGTAGGSVIGATAIFGATTALPFFCLALVPGALKSLPRGGNWFHSLKVVLGTLELAAALKFLSNADIYWRWGILTQPVFLALWVLAAAFMTAYVAGLLRFAHDEPLEEGAPKLRVRPLLAAIPFLALTCGLARGLDSVESWPGTITGFLPPDPYPGRDTRGGPKLGLPEYESYEKALAAAKKSGKPLLLEFTGHV